MSKGRPDGRFDVTALEVDLQRFDTSLRRLEKEYTMFFGGQLARPPLELRAAVERIVRRWERERIEGSTARFRFDTLLQRYRTFTTMWDRGMRAREEGRPGPFSRR